MSTAAPTRQQVDWTPLQNAIAGEVVVPESPDYETRRKPALAQFWSLRPRAIVRCREPPDVVAALAFARQSGAPFATRSGGHCFAGRSSTDGIVVDVSPINAISVEDGIASVGAGARLGDVYDALDVHGVTIPAGCGPTVGIAGLVLGGGLGILGRKYGLTSDQLVAAQVVLADGRVVECDEHHHAELFWALRGAGGCQFGVLTNLSLRTVPAPTATTLHLQWPHRDAVAIVEEWQQWAPDAPDEVAASLLVTAGAERSEAPLVHLFGSAIATEADTTALLAGLVARVGSEPSSFELHELPYRQAKRHLAGDGPGDKPIEAAHVFGKSEYFRQPLPRHAVAQLLEHVAANRRSGEARVLDFMPWGGAYNRVPAHATAFAHRGERFLLKHDVAFGPGASPQQERSSREWLHRSWSIVHAWGSGRVYPNFPDPELEDWPVAYHATNLDRLIDIKKTYDPDNVFRFHQSLPVDRP